MKLRFALRSMTVLLAMCSAALAGTAWYVDGVNGSDNNNCKSPQTACKTIGHAISLASSGDSVMVAAATYTEHLTISISLKVIGADTQTTIVDGGHHGPSVVSIPNTGSYVALSKLTIQNGLGFLQGGGIYNFGTLTISNDTISRNFACRGGGGIYNGGKLKINNSTIDRNTVFFSRIGCSGNGGGILNDGILTINNSTISTNSASTQSNYGLGGGVYNNGTSVVNNSTFSGNSCGKTSGGGGIGGKPATLQNSIVANSPSGGNCSGTMKSDGYNLSSDNTCNFNNTGDLNNTDPILGQLGNYGGPTQTIPLLSGSPAIDAGNPNGCTDSRGHLLKTDQRGKPRPDHEDTGGCDMGAFERQSD